MNLFDSTHYPNNEPATLVAGDRWAWKRTDLTDYAPSLYALSYEARLDGDGTDSISITTSGSGTEYVVEVAAATTAGYTPGTWHWSAFITRSADDERIRIDYGTWEIKADAATSEADPRSHAKKMLDGIESILEGKATASQVDYVSTALGTRSATRDPDLLRRWRAFYRTEYLAELAANNGDGGQKSNKIQVSF